MLLKWVSVSVRYSGPHGDRLEHNRHYKVDEKLEFRYLHHKKVDEVFHV